MTKVKLPKDVAEAIEYVRKCGFRNFTLINISSLREKFSDQHRFINWYCSSEEALNNYLLALVNGFEVEQTPEEKVREYYARLNGHDDQDDPEFWEQVGIEKTLDLLGIKINGVNA